MLIAHPQFKGEIPKMEAHLLPPMNAQLAQNCEFAGGALRPLKDGLLLKSMVTSPVRGLYTEDGLLFFTWNEEAQSFRSPVIDDTLSRMYFLQPHLGQFSVTTTLGMATDGGAPSGSNTWRAGVPQPTVAPVLALIDRTTLPDYPSIAIAATAWWESSGNTFGSAPVALVTVTALRNYTFTKPAKPVGTPDTATLAVRFVITDTANANREILSITCRASGTARSQSLPGGVEASLLDPDGATTAAIALSWGVAETRAYSYTNENAWTEEGAPAPPATVSVTYLQDVRVTVAASSFTGFKPFSKYNIYRTFGTNANYIKIAPSGSGLVYVDASRVPVSIGTVLESTDWLPSPTGLQGAVLMPNGWFAAFKGNTLYMSEPYRPWAWPYSKTFSGNIRGICVSQQNSLVVTRTNGVSIVTGAFPSNCQEMELALPQPGVSQKSMTNVEGAVAYASNDGLVMVSGSVPSLDVSQKLFTRDAWRTRYGAILAEAAPSLRLGYHDGHLVASSSTQVAGAGIGFILRLDEDVGSLSRHTIRMDSTFQLPLTDTLYYSVGSAIYRFREGSNLAFDWWGKDHVYPRETAPGAGYIRCDGATRLTIYADGVEWYDTATDTKRGGAGLTTGDFRVPGGTLAHRWSIRLRGAFEVQEFRIASSAGELNG